MLDRDQILLPYVSAKMIKEHAYENECKEREGEKKSISKHFQTAVFFQPQIPLCYMM